MISWRVSNRLANFEASRSPALRVNSEKPAISEKKIVTCRRPACNCCRSSEIEPLPLPCTRESIRARKDKSRCELSCDYSLWGGRQGIPRCGRGAVRLPEPDNREAQAVLQRCEPAPA